MEMKTRKVIKPKTPEEARARADQIMWANLAHGHSHSVPGQCMSCGAAPATGFSCQCVDEVDAR